MNLTYIPIFGIALVIGIVIGGAFVTCGEDPTCEVCKTCEICPTTSPSLCPVAPNCTQILSSEVNKGLTIDDCQLGHVYASFKQSDSYKLRDNIYNTTENLWESTDRKLNTTVTGCSDDFGCLSLLWHAEKHNTSDWEYRWL